MTRLKKYKYCIETSRSDDHSVLVKTSRELLVTVNLAEEKKNCLLICLAKNGNEHAYGFPPKTDEYTIVKYTSLDEFDKAYNQFLKTLHQINTANGEFYLMKKSDGHPNGMAWYSDGKEIKMGLQIQFYDDAKDFSIRIEHIKTWQGVQHFRRSQNILSAEMFNTFFALVVKYLHDQENYDVNKKEFVKQFKGIIDGSQPIIDYAMDWKIDNGLVVEKIANRIASIEKRLLEFDNDPVKRE